MKRLAIVGPREDSWPRGLVAPARHRILELLAPGAIMVSGHCPKGGVDIWAEEAAVKLGCPMHLFPAYAGARWDGFKARNKLIAHDADEVHVIVPWLSTGACYHCRPRLQPAEHPPNGGCWTGWFADGLGKPTTWHVIR